MPSPFVPGGPARRYGRAGISFFKARTISFNDKGFRFSNQVEDGVDIATRSLRVRTELFCLLHQLLGNVALDTWQADVKTGAEKITGVCQVQVHFGVDGQVRRQSDLLLGGQNTNNTFETGRPARGEELLGIGADARRAWN